jgi:manganese oxidase
MRQSSERREFLKTGAIAAAGSLAAGWMHESATGNELTSSSAHSEKQANDELADVYDGFSRYYPSRGNDPDSEYYLGKLVPGFRAPAEGPAPFAAPDLDKLPWKLIDGVKEFHLVAQAVSREFLPGYAMRVYGFNGSMPGPTIEVTQGDRVRIIVHNELPEPTFIHWHGFELPIQFDGAAELTQNPIKPGGKFVYEFNVHEEGTFFYHSHVPMQEAFGMVGWFIVHPREVWDPPVDRDFGIIFQNFHIEPTQTISDSWAMDWSWHTMNGRSGPFATPLVVKHGERVRIRIMDFSPMQHHPIHIHGHTFWVTGHEGARAPKSAWVPRNTELIAIAQASEFEFIANNPGDWMFHCHMVHHMMNHMVRQAGPRVRKDVSVDAYLANLDNPPRATSPLEPAFSTPGYPQQMQGMEMNADFMQRIWSRREVQGMRANWPMGVMGLMTAVRVLPEDLYQQVMESEQQIEKGAVFAEIVRRFGDPSMYQRAPMSMEHGMGRPS